MKLWVLDPPAMNHLSILGLAEIDHVSPADRPPGDIRERARQLLFDLHVSDRERLAELKVGYEIYVGTPPLPGANGADCAFSPAETESRENIITNAAACGTTTEVEHMLRLI